MLINIEGKDKEDYLTGEVEKPDKKDPKYRRWKIENAMVKGWLLGTMKPEISDRYLFGRLPLRFGMPWQNHILNLTTQRRCMNYANGYINSSKMGSHFFSIMSHCGKCGTD